MNYNPKDSDSETMNSWEAQLQGLVLEVKQFFPDLDKKQIERLANNLLVFSHLKDFSQDVSENVDRFELAMQHVQKNLSYAKPFRIAVVAVTGQGKSTLLNALLFRQLVLVGNVGGAATGCTQQIFQDVLEGEPEIARIEYRDEANVLELIDRHFIQRYQLDASDLPKRINEEFVRLLGKQEPLSPLGYEEQNEFDKLRDALVDLARQFVRHSNQETQEFVLSDDAQCKKLEQLTNETSDLNSSNSSDRRISLIKCVDYHIRPSDSQALHLPKNVCLVDLPGVGATQFHNLVIHEGIQNADAILFVVHPRRFYTQQNQELLERARRFITLEGDPRSTERIFLVVNAKDEIMTDSLDELQQMRQQASDLLEQLFPGSSQHCSRYEISAWAALQAQKVRKGEKPDNPRKYSSVCNDLGVQEQDPDAVWQVSHVPLLIENLNTFIAQRIERQIREAERGLAQILDSYFNDYQQHYQSMTKGAGDLYLRKRAANLLDERYQQIYKLLKEFRRRQLDSLAVSRSTLERVASRLYDSIDQELRTEMPGYWKEAFAEGEYVPSSTSFARVMKERFLGDVEVSLWQHISKKAKVLAQELAEIYQSALEVSDLPQSIAINCFDCIDLEAINATFQQCIAQMEQNLTATVRGVALSQLANPANGFIPFLIDGTPQPSALMDAIPPYLEEELTGTAFDGFVQRIRQHYEHTVNDSCITGLLNVYCYEMLCCQQSIIHYSQEVFDRIRLGNDPVLYQKILNTIPDADLRYLEILEEKLSILNNLKLQLSLTQRREIGD